MFQKDCRLARAAKYYGGGGGGTDINQSPGGFRNWPNEQKDIKKGYDFNIDEYNNYVEQNPLLNAAQGGALDFWKQLPGMLSQFPGFQKEISGDQSQIQGYQGQLGDISKQLGGFSNLLGGLFNKTGALGQNYNKFLGPGSALSAAYGGPSGIGATLAAHGALSQEAANAALQQGRVNAGQAGTTRDPSSIIQDYVSRKSATDANFNQALGQSQSVLGQQDLASKAMQGIFGQQGNILQQRAGIGAQQAGIAGQGAGLSQMLAGLTGQKAGLLGQQQALQTGGLNQLLGTGNAAVSQFGGLTNPILSYMQGIFGGNQQAAIAQAQTNAQANAAGSGKAGGAMAGVGSIIGAVLPLLFSDERIKTKVKDTGIKTDDDVPIKTFEYKTRPGVPFIGVMAQDVEKVRPDAVVTDPTSGVKMVNFWKVQVPMAQLNRGKL